MCLHVSRDDNLQSLAFETGLRNVLLRHTSSLQWDGPWNLNRNQQSDLSPHRQSLSIRSEAEKPVFLGKSVSPVIFRDLLPWLMLAVPRLHRFNLGERSPALRGIARGVTRHEFADQVGALQHDAPLRGLGRRLAKVTQEGGLVHDLEDAPVIVNGFPGELNNRTRLDIAVGADMVADAGRHRA